MSTIGPIGEKCVYVLHNIRYWLLKATFAVATIWMLSLACPMKANAQTPVNPGKTNPACSNEATSESTDPTAMPVKTMSFNTNNGLFGYIGGGFGVTTYAVTNAIDSLRIQIIGKSTEIVAMNDSTTEIVPCSEKAPAKPLK